MAPNNTPHRPELFRNGYFIKITLKMALRMVMWSKTRLLSQLRVFEVDLKF